MSIKSMVQDSMGYVDDQDRSGWAQREAAIRNDQEPSFTKAMVNGVTQSVLGYAEKAAVSAMRAEDENKTEARGKRRIRVVEKEEVVNEYDKDGNEMDI